MPPAKIHTVGPHVGTCEDFCEITKIATANMYRRIEKFKAGVYTVEQCMAVGTLSRRHEEHCGTDEWRALSNHVKDARMRIEDVSNYWEAIIR